jgi:hypothetical protein
MIAVFSEKDSPRLEYILHHIITVMWGHPYRLFLSEDAFAETEAEAKINYSDLPLEGAFRISPHGLLSETGVLQRRPKITWRDGTPYCFLDQSPDADTDGDPLAACFYFLSRYEEMLSHTPDAHGRFRAEESVAFQDRFLHLAVVDRWMAELAGALQRMFPAFHPVPHKARFHPTYDIDIAYAYREKGFMTNAAGFAKQLLHGDWNGIRNRAQVLAGRKSDPYDTFDTLQQRHRNEGLHPTYFVLFAPRGRYDKGIAPERPAFRQRITSLAEEAEMGIHASYAASSEKEPLRLLSEKEALATLLHRKVTANRFHYLHFRLPESYRLLLQAGITEDYSMGFANAAGFRAGTCNPFYFFDLERNEATPLRIHPLLFMENAFFGCHDRSEANLWQQMQPLLDECIRFGGEIVTLFHNHSFGELPGHDLPVPTLHSQIIHYIK